MKKAAATPEEFVNCYEAALASQQWVQVEPLMHEDVCVTFSNGAVHTGVAAVREAFSGNFEIIKDEKYLVSDVHWAVKKESIAVYLFKYSWSGLINGMQTSGSGRGTATLVLDGDAWKLIAEHLGPDR